jgi:hypothetical protein
VAEGLGLILLLLAFRALRRRRLIDDIPTSRVQGVFIGLVEVKGTAESEQPLASVLAGVACVSYAWSAEEHWSRTRMETVRDSKGRTHTRVRHESGWTRVAGGAEAPPFYLRDDSGALRICPAGAEVHMQRVFDRTVTPADPLYYEKGPAGAIPHSDRRRRFREDAIRLHAPLYVIGQARERTDAVAAEIAAAPGAPLFLVSTRGEEELRAQHGFAAAALAALGALIVVVGAFFAGGDAGAWLPVAGAGLAVYGAFCVTGWCWTVFNSLVALRQRVRQAWTLIDIQLRRRHELIPRLVETVRGLAAHERQVQETVAALRAQFEATPPGQAGPDFAGCRPAIAALAERYPDVLADGAFRDLQRALADTEERIALARGYYNDIATFYNTRLDQLPDRFLARLASMQPAPLLAAAGFERAPVPVHLVDAPPAAGGEA